MAFDFFSVETGTEGLLEFRGGGVVGESGETGVVLFSQFDYFFIDFDADLFELI